MDLESERKHREAGVAARELIRLQDPLHRFFNDRCNNRSLAVRLEVSPSFGNFLEGKYVPTENSRRLSLTIRSATLTSGQRWRDTQPIPAVSRCPNADVECAGLGLGVHHSLSNLRRLAFEMATNGGGLLATFCADVVLVCHGRE